MPNDSQQAWAPPEGFGVDPSPHWSASQVDDPCKIAAYVLQHRLVMRVRQERPDHRSQESDRALAVSLGLKATTGARLLAGGNLMRLDHLLRLACSAGFDILDEFPRSLDQVLPPQAPPLDPAWVAGGWTTPSFGESTGLNWATIAEEVCNWVESEAADGRTHLICAEAVRSRLFHACLLLGVEADDLSIEPEVAGAGFAVDGSDGPVGGGVIVALEDGSSVGARRAAEARLVEAFQAVASSGNEAVFVIVAASKIVKRLARRGSGFTSEGSLFSIPFSGLQELSEVHHLLPVDLSGEVHAVRAPGDTTVLVGVNRKMQ